MSEPVIAPDDTLAPTMEAADDAQPARSVRIASGRRRWWRKPVVAAVTGVVLIAVPYYLDAFWLTLGSFAAATAIGAIGLTVLFGRVGQLSLAHSFFLAVGAYGYILFGSEAADEQWGFGWPPLLAAVAAIVLAGVCGAVCSPIAGRLKGINLGVASIALVFIGEHLLFSLPQLSGGFNGRTVPELTIGGFEVVGTEPEIIVGGIPFERPERLWLLCGCCLLLALWFTTRALRGRAGRAFVAVRDGEYQAAALGINVARVRANAFLFSSVLAGLAGVLLAVAFRRVVPDYWSLMLALEYLAMIVLGGIGSLRGAVGGAVFVIALPLLLQRYGTAIPGMTTDPDAAFPPSVVAQFVFGILVVAILLIEPKGMAEIARRLGRRTRRDLGGHRPADS